MKKMVDAFDNYFLGTFRKRKYYFNAVKLLFRLYILLDIIYCIYN